MKDCCAVADGSSVRLVKASLGKCDLGVKGGGKSFVSRGELCISCFRFILTDAGRFGMCELENGVGVQICGWLAVVRQLVIKGGVGW